MTDDDDFINYTQGEVISADVGHGALVMRGVRWTTTLALVVFGLLFAAQVITAGDAAAPAPAVLMLAVVLVPLILAVRARRRAEDG